MTSLPGLNPFGRLRAGIDNSAGTEARRGGAGNNRGPFDAGSIDWPPIISLEETRGFTFRRGSAVLGDGFTRNLETDVHERVKSDVEKYGVRIVEVVGHTDEEPVGAIRLSNLDLKATPALRSDTEISDLEVSDIAGLGLARAISAARVLQKFLAENPEYDIVTVLPYSAGHVIGLNERVSLGVGNLELSDRNRRRIEIRLRGSDLASRVQ